MGIVTRIEEKLEILVENPFKAKNVLDLPGIEIALKRCMERRRKNILGKIVVPHVLCVTVDEKVYAEYDPFLEEIIINIKRSLNQWLSEKDYDVLQNLELRIQGAPLGGKVLDVSASYKCSGEALLPGNVSSNGNFRSEREVVGVLLHNGTGKRYAVYREGTLIGRGEECSIRLDDLEVSKRHAELEWLYGKVMLRDLGSRNGTRVNSRQIKRKILTDGDRVLVGNLELVFKEGSKTS